jgi:hypothetical protein
LYNLIRIIDSYRKGRKPVLLWNMAWPVFIPYPEDPFFTPQPPTVTGQI